MVETPNDLSAAGGGAFDALVRLAWRCGTFATGVATLAIGALWYKQQESLLYFPSIGSVPRHNAQNPRRYRSPSEHNIPFETHNIPCADGTNIHSWLLHHPESSGTKVPTIIFFHGNAGNIGIRLPNAIQMYHYLKANIWLIEYRGYGDSDDAKINEAGLKLDAEAVWNYVHNPQTRNLPSVDPKRMFVFGRSLGGAVAFHLAQYSQAKSYPPLAGVIVENTFLSISEMVDHLLPYVAPFKALVLRMNWDSGSIAPSIRIPTLFLAGAKDTLVPHSHMLELFNRMKTSKVENIVRMHIVEDGTHNETWMQGGRAYWTAISKFIDEVFAAERPNDASYSRSGSAVKNGTSRPFQRKANSGLSSVLTSTTCSTSAEDQLAQTNSIEVDMGGEEAAGLISGVGSIVGMAREATRTVAGGAKGVGGANAHNKKD
ncbi:hypothetical protein ACHAXT_009467 [Thalassiosira profunda]